MLHQSQQLAAHPDDAGEVRRVLGVRADVRDLHRSLPVDHDDRTEHALPGQGWAGQRRQGRLDPDCGRVGRDRIGGDLLEHAGVGGPTRLRRVQLVLEVLRSRDDHTEAVVPGPLGEARRHAVGPRRSESVPDRPADDDQEDQEGRTDRPGDPAAPAGPWTHVEPAAPHRGSEKRRHLLVGGQGNYLRELSGSISRR